MMNKNLLIGMLFLLITGFLFTSCEKDYQVYENDLAAVRLNLENFTKGADSLVFSFALKPGVTEDTIAIPLQILGFTAPVDRLVNMMVDPGKTTAVKDEDFVIQSGCVLADSINGEQQVIVRKTDKLKTKNVTIALEVAESADFIPGPVNRRFIRIILTDQLVKPSDWVDAFGEYSRIKHQFVIQVTGLGTDYGSWKNDYTIVTYYVQMLNKALFEYNSAHPDAPLVDENGIPISFPG